MSIRMIRVARASRFGIDARRPSPSITQSSLAMTHAEMSLIYWQRMLNKERATDPPSAPRAHHPRPCPAGRGPRPVRDRGGAARAVPGIAAHHPVSLRRPDRGRVAPFPRLSNPAEATRPFAPPLGPAAPAPRPRCKSAHATNPCNPNATRRLCVCPAAMRCRPQPAPCRPPPRPTPMSKTLHPATSTHAQFVTINQRIANPCTRINPSGTGRNPESRLVIPITIAVL